MFGKIRLGYPTQNLSTDYRINRTVKLLDRPGPDVIEKSIELAVQNLDDLERIVEWNATHGLYFFRVSSEIFPHISNWRIIEDKMNWRQLAYPIEQFAAKLARIGKLAKKNGQRLTFHPGLFTVLNTANHFVLISVWREIWWHVRFLELCGLPLDSTITIHGGGVYGDRTISMDRFIENFNAMPARMRVRLILENDETSYCAEDVLKLSARIKPYEWRGLMYSKIPICFDYFHYCCWNLYRKKNSEKYRLQQPIEALLGPIRRTWQHGRRQKMHLSEQKPDAPIGTHSDYIEDIPEVLRPLDIDLMLESKCGDLAVWRLLNNNNLPHENPLRR
jgi:UV DNA damage endonuclease